MKKLTMLVLGLLLLGAGCASPTEQNSAGADLPEWYIDFETGDTWYAMTPYLSPAVQPGEAIKPSTARGYNRAWIQTTTEAVLPEGFSPREGMTYAEGDWLLVDATAYPEPATIPAQAERVEFGGKPFGVLRRDAGDVYYYDAGERLYEMYFYSADDTDPEEVFATIVETDVE